MQKGVILSRTDFGINSFCSNVAVVDDRGIYHQKRLMNEGGNFFQYNSFPNYSKKEIKGKWVPRRIIKFQPINHQVKIKRRSTHPEDYIINPRSLFLSSKFKKQQVFSDIIDHFTFSDLESLYPGVIVSRSSYVLGNRQLEQSVGYINCKKVVISSDDFSEKSNFVFNAIITDMKDVTFFAKLKDLVLLEKIKRFGFKKYQFFNDVRVRLALAGPWNGNDDNLFSVARCYVMCSQILI